MLFDCVPQRHSIGTTSVQYAHWFLREMSEEVNQVITAICEEQCMLSYKVLSKQQSLQKVYIVYNNLQGQWQTMRLTVFT